MSEIIEHPMPTSEQMRDAVQRRIDLGLPLGASHVTDYSNIEKRVIQGSTAGRWNYCSGFSRKKGGINASRKTS